ncbi:hypothetical protein PV08_08977 [Exophiala spinifera]|uniref:Carboxylic ester hydrolase n=1 Tax=Exophiala spinifera TaxID=91928 RepID=A0A0D1YFB9_9EURO|nr:uncharacterized protein PV08_08977 [Exophiala spinifera]KIW13786.1 hypothetical protein PV08_08977 [Exophiala spinifera]
MAKSNTHMSATLLLVFLSLGLSQSQSLPKVDLGYQIHQAISYNSEYQYYNFSNIRYAQAPVGDLRFAAPVAPQGRNEAVQNGSVGAICPQAQASWVPMAYQYAAAVLANRSSSFNITQAEEVIAQTPFDELPVGSPRLGELPPRDPREREDCLFLDVMVPRSVFERAANKSANGAPVLIWIFGGGYVTGSKYDFDPRGMLEAATKDDGEGLIYVAMNYRVGAFGWLGGPTLEAAGGTPNAGFFDQRLAMQWVQDHIHLFGGDPNRVTIQGESAGGKCCSVVNHLLAFGGEKKPPFQRAIANSAGIIQSYSNQVVENVTQSFLSLLNVTTIEAARHAPSRDIIMANARQELASAYGLFLYNPVPDGVFMRQLPSLALLSGHFAKNISVFYSYTQNEGLLFVPPSLQKEEDVTPWLRTVYPTIVDAVATHIQTVLYPPVYDGSQPYLNLPQRIALIIREMAVSCNADFLRQAYLTRTYTYRFDVGPSLHGSDQAYVSWDGRAGTNASQSFFAPLARQVQSYFVNFIQTGNPNAQGLPPFPIEGANSSANRLTASGFLTQPDPEKNPRCAWWAKALAT